MVTSALLTLIAIPVTYYLSRRGHTAVSRKAGEEICLA